MNKYKDFFRDKKITVMGLGLLGRGVGDTAFLAECGAELIVTDMKTEEVLKESLDTLSAYTNITYTLGEHREEDFKGRDMILKAAGVPLDSPFIEVARSDGAEIMMSGALFAKLSGIPIIGVTGTRGKSTVTHMIHHVLTQMTEGGKIILGGNVRGVSNLQLLKDVEEDLSAQAGALAVMELDSWQLQGFGEMKISPHIAVFTNFMEDHMNYYLASERRAQMHLSDSERAQVESSAYYRAMDAYFLDKAQIFLHQEESGVFITTPEVFERIKKLPGSLGQEVILVDSSVIPEDYLLAMPGEHNRLNAALAYEALKATGLTEEEIFEGLASFPGVPGRLQYLGEKDGVKIYNDNNATTPSATIAGIRAVANPPTGQAGGKNVILIAGGSYKEIDPTPLVEAMGEYCKNVVLLPGTGTDKLIPHFDNLPFEWKVVEGTSGNEVMQNAVKTGLAKGEPGDILLFSPGFASFGMFQNEYDRGDQFVEIVNRL